MELSRAAAWEAHGNEVPHGSSAAHGNQRAHGSDTRRMAQHALTGTNEGARQRRCRPKLWRRTAKTALPFAALPCCHCRADLDGNGFTEIFWPFAVRYRGTAVPLSPVVRRDRDLSLPFKK